MCALYSPTTYDSFHARYTLTQCKNGGKKRAQLARRDRYGRMLPNNGTLPEPVNHGVAGGKARISKALRNERGQFVRKEK